MKNILLFLLFYLQLPIESIGQEKDCKKYFNLRYFSTIYLNADTLPEPINGYSEIFNAFCKFYLADKNSTQKSFVFDVYIAKNGYLKKIKIHNKKNKNLTKEEKNAINVMGKMRHWKPAKCKNKYVNFMLTIPLKI
jgi:hypothetical protein